MAIPILDELIAVFGPFIIPVLLFAGGVVGYVILVELGRAGLSGTGPGDAPAGVDEEREETEGTDEDGDGDAAGADAGGSGTAADGGETRDGR